MFDKSAKSGGKFRRVMGGLGKTLKVAAVGIAAVGGAAVAGGLKVLQMGAKFEDLDKKAEAVFEGQLPMVQRWAKENAGAMGLTARQLTGLTANFADLLKPMGFTAEQAAEMAQETNELSGALAKWSGGQKSAAEVSEILAKAMLGEREGLKQLGISITEADVKTRLAAKGQEELTGTALEQAKAIATQELIMEKSTDAQKAWADGQDDLSVKLNKVRAFVQELKEKAIEKLLPFVIEAAKKFREWGAAIAQKVQPVIETLGAWWQDNGPAIVARAQEIAQMVGDVLVATLVALGDWWSQHGPKIIAAAEMLWEGVQTAFDGIVSAGEFVLEHWDKFKVAIIAAVAIMIPHWVALAAAAGVSAAKQAASWVVTQAAAIKSAVVHSAQVAKMVAGWIVLGAKSLIAAAKVAAAWLISIGPIALVVAAVVGLVALIVKNWDTIKDVIAAGWEFVKAKTSAFVAAVTGFVRDLKDRIVGFVRGAVDFIRQHHPLLILFRIAQEQVPKIVAKVREVKDRIVEFFSSAGEWLLDAGKRIIDGLIEGIKAKIQAVKDTIGNVAGAIRDRLPFSPAKEGPLSGRGSPDLAGRQISNMLAAGIERERDAVAEAIARLTEPAANVTAGGRRGRTDGRHTGNGPAGGDRTVVQHFHGDVTDDVTGRKAALALRMAP